MELASLICIISRLERFVRNIFVGDTVSQGTFEHIYDVGPFKNSVDEEELLEIFWEDVLNFL